jgi:PAS domain S-box-containing protein
MKLVTLITILLTLAGCADAARMENVDQAQLRDVTLEPFEDFVENASIGIHLVAGDGTILWANTADYAPLGYTEAQYVGHDIRDFHASQDTITAMLAILGSGGELVNYPAKLVASNGTIVYVSIRSKFNFTHGHTRCFTSVISRPVWEVLWAEQQGL